MLPEERDAKRKAVVDKIVEWAKIAHERNPDFDNLRKIVDFEVMALLEAIESPALTPAERETVAYWATRSPRTEGAHVALTREGGLTRLVLIIERITGVRYLRQVQT